jgi:hypothetical protein
LAVWSRFDPEADTYSDDVFETLAFKGGPEVFDELPKEAERYELPSRDFPFWWGRDSISELTEEGEEVRVSTAKVSTVTHDGQAYDLLDVLSLRAGSQVWKLRSPTHEPADSFLIE